MGVPVKDAVAGGTSGTATLTMSLAHAANVLIIVVVAIGTTQTISSVKIGATSFTQIGTVASTGGTNNLNVYAFYLWVAAAATDTITVTQSGSVKMVASAVSYTGGAQASPWTETSITGATTADITTALSVTVAAGSIDRLVVQCFGLRSASGANTVTIAPGASQTEEREDDYALNGLSSEINDEATNGSVSMSATPSANSSCATVAFAILPFTTAVNVSDSGSGVEARMNPNLSLSDSGAGADSDSNQATLPLSDSVAGADTVLRQYGLVGLTKDSVGNVIASCTVWLFKTIDQSFIASTTSDGSGSYMFIVADTTTQYFVRAYNDAYLGNRVFGTSDRTLVAT